MSLNFSPQSEEEVLNLLPTGEYDFLVKNAEHYTAPSTGNQSIKLTLSVYDANGVEKTLTCFLTVKFMFLLKHFMDSVGLSEQYNAGNLSAEMCLNQSGRCKVIIEQPKDGSPYGPKNTIKDFIKKSDAVSLPAEQKNDFIDDTIPF